MITKEMYGEVRGAVYEVMKNDYRAREDDNYLYIKVLEKMSDKTSINPDKVTATYFFTNAKYMVIPSFESVSRTRRWWQEKEPSFKLTAEQKKEKERQVKEVQRLLGYRV